MTTDPAVPGVLAVAAIAATAVAGYVVIDAISELVNDRRRRRTARPGFPKRPRP